MLVTRLTAEKERLEDEICSIGADPCAKRMWEKGAPLSLKIAPHRPYVANIIKQEAIASGIDAAVHFGAANCSVEESGIIIIGSVRGVGILSERLKKQGGVFADIALELERAVNKSRDGETPFTLALRGRRLPLKDGVVMGILNATPDSFSDGGVYKTPAEVEGRIKEIFDEGGKIVDIGGVSTRPGYTPVEIDEEEKRILPAVEIGVKIAESYGGFISVDTSTPTAARKALEAGADMINDQNALQAPNMADICAEYRAAAVLMDNLSAPDAACRAIEHVKSALCNAAERALKAGVDRSSIVIDPGFGFGKSYQVQYSILKYLSELCSLNYPILVGVSRKSM
ncbi:MAG: dihydropteroate synthase, partial [Deferribacteraceae bacterium]|nr:dihydropteroate synthase [Deferribacteraceae bacterium]